jgi:hypothetical protein
MSANGRNLSVLFLASLWACGSGVGVGGSLDVESVDARSYGEWNVYSAKFLCGTIIADENLPESPAGWPEQPPTLVPGFYLTSVNVLNLDTTVVRLWKKAVEIRAQRSSRGMVGEEVRDTLGMNRGLNIDCPDILLLLNQDYSPRVSFVEGFVVIRSRHLLDVEAVYSFKNVEIRSQ